MKTGGKTGLWLALVGAVTILAGVLFGYDQGVISGALPLLTDQFDLSTTMQQVVTSWVTLGALVGALVAGGLADRIGRRRTAILAGLLFLVGAVVQGTADGEWILVVGRLIVGFAVGVASVAAPLYAAEMAPAKVRGRYVSMYQLAITMGIFVAYLVDDFFTAQERWRPMFLLAIIPGALLALVMLFMPETPRWLVKARRSKEAESALHKVQPGVDAPAEITKIEDDLAHDEQASWKEVFAPNVRRALWVGLGLAVIQQVTGINAVIYYSNEIFKEAGFDTPEDQAKATLYAIGAVNVLATFIAIAYVDRFGRKPLLRAGLIGMTVSLAALGLAFAIFDNRPPPPAPGTATGPPSVVGILTLVCMVVYIASFAFSLGPVVWTMINEIYPNRIRGKAVSVATAANWGAAFLVSMTFLSLLDALGGTLTFWLFGVISIVSFAWIGKKVPETKGKTLEEVAAIFDLPVDEFERLAQADTDAADLVTDEGPPGA
jgi:sugar porter (SP) family MFS transporter